MTSESQEAKNSPPLEVVGEETTKTPASDPESTGGRGGGLRKVFWIAAFALVLLAVAALGTTGYLGQRELRGRIANLEGELSSTRAALATEQRALGAAQARADGLQTTMGRVNELSNELAASLQELQALTGSAPVVPASSAAGEPNAEPQPEATSGADETTGAADESEATTDPAGDFDADGESASETPPPPAGESASETLPPPAGESASETLPPSAGESASETLPPSAGESASETLPPSAGESASETLPPSAGETPGEMLERGDSAPLSLEEDAALERVIPEAAAPSILEGGESSFASGASTSDELNADLLEIADPEPRQDLSAVAGDELPMVSAAAAPRSGSSSEAAQRDAPEAPVPAPFWERLVERLRALAPSE